MKPSFFASRSFLPLVAIAVLLTTAPSALAQFATGGAGLHRSRIFWVSWGTTDGTNVWPPRTVTRGFNVDTPASPANRLDITCSLANGVSTVGGNNVYVYTPGTWQGDGLDELYNIGGNQPGTGANPNTLRIGLATQSGGRIAFDFSCSATLGGQPFALNGLVFADAEASGGTEYVGIQLPSGSVLRVIDQISQCGTFTNVTYTVGVPAEIRFNGPASGGSCENNANPALRAGPVLVGFLDGATSARVIERGGGKSAIALGAVIEMEYSEAVPNTYGNAAHVLTPTWTGGLVSPATAGTNFNTPGALATPTYGARLGATVQPDIDANGVIGGPDVDALPKTTGPAGSGYANVPGPNALPGGTYTIANIACSGLASVAGWIDFNGNGVFDSGERSNTATCAAGNSTVSLTWTLPNDYLPQATSYMRLRLAPLAAGVANPSGVSQNGEAEDYRIVLPKLTPQVRIAKVSQGGTGSFSFTTTNLVGAPSPTLVTTTAGSPVQSSPADRNQNGTAVSITEIVPAGWTLTGASCSDLNATQTGNPASFGTLAGAVLTIDSGNLRPRSDIVCTFNNRKQVQLSLRKTWSGAVINDTATLSTTGLSNNISGFVSTANSANETDTAPVVIAYAGETAVLSETLGGGNIGLYHQALACTGAADTNLSDGLTIGTGDSSIVCTYTNTRHSADLSIAKTNNQTSLTAGTSTTYQITVTNNGIDPVNGAVVKDVLPGAPLNCPSSGAVACSGPVGACPSSATISQLTGAGVTLGALANGAVVTLSFTCNVGN